MLYTLVTLCNYHLGQTAGLIKVYRKDLFLYKYSGWKRDFSRRSSIKVIYASMCKNVCLLYSRWYIFQHNINKITISQNEEYPNLSISDITHTIFLLLWLQIHKNTFKFCTFIIASKLMQTSYFISGCFNCYIFCFEMYAERRRLLRIHNYFFQMSKKNCNFCCI